ncbi:type I glyceraldehyde-3-phosphate dehydrogenase [Jannaschia sp. R86511]|uniref:type I glyceraldehyde-3-phosphate dehydrogenase n=1 Tax=Jannaschia sp. R86511 TaxID=3093853 RepID=UPI0036D39795
MNVRVGINGMGRIGRDVLRSVLQRQDLGFDVVAINDVAPPATVVHLLRHDSTYGRWTHLAELVGDDVTVDGRFMRITQQPDPALLDWAGVGVEVVIEATGRFRTREKAATHLAAGARKVVLTSPGTGVDTTLVMGINDELYDPATHHVISNASCTTNCAAPMAQVLDDAFGIEEGLLTTIHSYTSDQNLLDGPHKDLRRARSAAVNIIPTTTGAARAIGQVLPRLAGRLDGVAVRVPVVDGSLVDLTVRVRDSVTAEQVNAAFELAADGPLKGILRYTNDPVVSQDVVGESASCLFDSELTKAVGSTVKVFGWYDNEWGYAQRTVDLVDVVARTLLPRAATAAPA